MSTTVEELEAAAARLEELTGLEWRIETSDKWKNHCMIWADEDYQAMSNGQTRWKRDKALDYLNSLINSVELGLNQPQDAETEALLEAVRTNSGFLLGVLDTPARPDRYYAGYVVTIGDQYYPYDDNPVRFHPTIKEAQAHLYEFVQEIDEE
jgi:hypothetical protein